MSPSALTPIELYKQGSKSCQLYSDITMRIRTLAQQVVIAYAAGLGVLATQLLGEPVLCGIVMIFSGAIAERFGENLRALNRHYSFAFEAIRDRSLVPLEEAVELKNETDVGPWTAHKQHRADDTKTKMYAWDGPFDTLRWFGIAGIVGGAAAIVYGVVR